MDKFKQYKQLDTEYIGFARGSRKFKHLDPKTGKIVAYKTLMLQPAASQETGVPSTILREISLLKVMKHENIARLHDIDYDAGKNVVRAIFEYTGEDLTNFILNNPVKANDHKLIKKLLYQLLRGISYYHSVKAAHGSLNSTNVLIDSTNDSLKIINLDVTPNYSNRAPEILLGSTEFSFAADMFSVGCIFGEMVTQKPLFSNGGEAAELRSIFKLLGTPTEENWPRANQQYKRLSQYEKVVPKDLKEVFPSLEENGVDLLSKLLRLDPRRRISAADALKHPYFRDVELPVFNFP